MKIPHSTLDVSEICLGTSDFGTKYSDEDSFRVLDRYVELGGNFLDGAHCYAFWKSGYLGYPERLVGRWIRTTGAKVAFATKGGHPDGGPDYPRPEHYLAPEVLRSDIRDCLDRSGASCLDLFYLHRDDGVTPVDEIIDVLNEEIDAGRLRALGVSNWSVTRLAEANKYAESKGKQPFVATQPQWSLAVPTWSMGVEPTNRYVLPEDLAFYRKGDVAVIPYSSTANGFFASVDPDKTAYSSPENLARYERVQNYAMKHGITPTQAALAWLRSHEFPVIPAIGTGNLAHLEEAFGAFSHSMTADDRNTLKGAD